MYALIKMARYICINNLTVNQNMLEKLIKQVGIYVFKTRVILKFQCTKGLFMPSTSAQGQLPINISGHCENNKKHLQTELMQDMLIQSLI